MQGRAAAHRNSALCRQFVARIAKAQAAASRLTPLRPPRQALRSSWRQHAGFCSLRQARGGQPQARSGAPQQQQEGGSTSSAAAKRAGGELEGLITDVIARLAGRAAAARPGRRRLAAARSPLPALPPTILRCLPLQVIPSLAGDATEQTPPDLPSYLFKERIVYLVRQAEAGGAGCGGHLYTCLCTSAVNVQLLRAPGCSLCSTALVLRSWGCSRTRHVQRVN